MQRLLKPARWLSFLFMTAVLCVIFFALPVHAETITTNYIALHEGNHSGYLLENTSGTTLTIDTLSAYSSGDSSPIEWNFIDYGSYYLVQSNKTGYYLTMNPSTFTVTLNSLVGTSGANYQQWKKIGNSDVFTLANCYGASTTYSLIINTTSTLGATLSVAPSSATPIGIFNVDTYVPPTSITISNFSIAPRYTWYLVYKPIPITSYTPSNATISKSWITWSTMGNVLLFEDYGCIASTTPDTSGVLLARDKITNTNTSCTVTVLDVVNEDTYYIKNSYSLLYLQQTDNSTTVLQQNFESDNSMVWRFLNFEGDYYLIENRNDVTTDYAYYLALDIYTNTYVLSEKVSNLNYLDKHLWKVEKLSNGNYTISPKLLSSSNGALAVSTTTAGATPYNSSYQGDVDVTSARHEWIITATQADQYENMEF